MQQDGKELFYDFIRLVVLPKLRRWINSNPKPVVGMAVLSFLLFAAIAVNIALPEKRVEITAGEKAWFYDLNTGKLFTAGSEPGGPVEAPSGPLADGQPAGVKAYVFSYSYNPKESDLFVGFLEKPDEGASASNQGRWGQGKLIRRPEDKRWVKAAGREGRDIIRQIFKPNDRGEVASYYPPP